MDFSSFLTKQLPAHQSPTNAFLFPKILIFNQIICGDKIVTQQNFDSKDKHRIHSSDNNLLLKAKTRKGKGKKMGRHR